VTVFIYKTVLLGIKLTELLDYCEVAQKSVSMIVGTVTRYLAGRGAVQTVYWVGDGSGGKMVKYSRLLTLADKNAAADTIPNNGTVYSQHQQRYPSSQSHMVRPNENCVCDRHKCPGQTVI
jgi:hypothetical protein